MNKRQYFYGFTYGKPWPVEGILGLQRARFSGIFAAVGILEIPSATLLRENRGRRTIFLLSTGRGASQRMHFRRHSPYNISS